MSHTAIIHPLEKALRFFAGLYVVVVAFQMVGLLMYLSTIWPDLQILGSTGEPISTGITYFLFAALVAGFVRSFIWIKIYWSGARVFSLLRTDNDSPELADLATPILATLTRLLILSCVLDVLFLPTYFLSDVFLPFSVSGWRLGVVEVARVVFPQAFGLAAVVLAFLTHQYGQLLKERGRMKNELDLTI